ncbi:DUF5722 domain-containing protein [Stieleria sp. JC731]|uniref:DUF5722 domain-containing protein n=1 Tax=Pirellulaceae TaxID=2691357 RepID=UPI001E44532E|nr:DUF5722 domain-containing protein [Stieleria sp. JC731]MCC9600241.1 DUF5722 domain-containing protein [Stieleria sp. JC731]
MTSRNVVAVVLLANLLLNPSYGTACAGGQLSIDWHKLAPRNNQVELHSGDSEIGLTTRGTDPFVWFELPSLSKQQLDWVFELSYFCADGVENLEWRIGDNASLSPVWTLPNIPKAEGWTNYTVNLSELLADRLPVQMPVSVRVDLGTKADVRITVRHAIVRPMTEAEQQQQKEERGKREAKQRLAERIANHQTRTWSADIKQVVAMQGDIRVAGELTKVDDGLSLTVRLPSEIASESFGVQERETWKLNPSSDGRFEVRLSKAESRKLLPGSRFQIVSLSEDGRQWRPESAEDYIPVSVDQSDREPPAVLHAAKGLTCIDTRFDSETLVELGLGHASVNLLIDGLVSPEEIIGWVPTEINGRQWWVNEARLSGYDRNIRVARQAECVVAGILLIQSGNHHTGTSLAHPEATQAGPYAMPDLTSEPSVHRYLAALDVLGRRYGGSESMLRVDHWIVHNEVDYGWQWTNMGEQPFEVFMEHYLRSMRLVDHVMRQYNRHSQVFISLTHRWNASDCIAWKTYAPREMIRWLASDSRLHGDFAWGVAYHPYPESLWNADFWNDTKVDDTDQTELITMKNLSVLDRLMHQPEMRQKGGALRPVICSEQGYHAAVDHPEQLKIQAQALLKTWQTLRNCPSVIAFDYHRPVDHPNEGGLRLGLRGLPSSSNPIGSPKPAWEVFKAIGTSDEASVASQLGID